MELSPQALTLMLKKMRFGFICKNTHKNCLIGRREISCGGGFLIESTGLEGSATSLCALCNNHGKAPRKGFHVSSLGRLDGPAMAIMMGDSRPQQHN